MKEEIYKLLLAPWILRGNKLDIECTLNDIMKIVAKEVKNKSFEFMEPCEPDCNEVRHAEHYGSWIHMTRMDNWANSLIKPNDID